MTNEKAIQGEANVAKYMALLESESDLKNKLQQFYLKKVEDDKIKDDEIKHLQDLLLDKEAQLNELEAKLEVLANKEQELEALSNNLKVQTTKLNQCRGAYYDLEEKLKEKSEQFAESSQEVNSLKTQLSDSNEAELKEILKVKAEEQADDLKRIKGIGPMIQAKLIGAGISTFKQIAAWETTDIDRFEKELSFKGRIQRDSWVEQAKNLSTEN